MNKREASRRTRSRRERGGILHVAPVRMHTLALTGQLGKESAVKLEAAIDELCASGVERLLLDLSELTGIDRTGIDVVAMRCRLCRRRGVTVELIGVNAAVAGAFAAAGLAEDLPFRENLLARRVS